MTALDRNTRAATDRRSERIVILTASGGWSYTMINALCSIYPDVVVFEERPESKWALTARRARRLGWTRALGQLATMALSRLSKRLSRKREREICLEYNVSAKPRENVTVIRVGSVNRVAVAEAVRLAHPGVVLTIGCGILGLDFLSHMTCPVMNFHAGINPLYRGQMGGYWAMVEDDLDNFGSTLHLVDAGVDTGATLYEKRVKPSRRDTMATYPLLLTAASVDIAVWAIDDALMGNLRPYPAQGTSVLRFPPPIWDWFRNGVIEGIW